MAPDEGLPRLEDLPAGEEGYARDAVASAFSAFQRRIGELEGTVSALRPVAAELRALHGAPPGELDPDDEGWQDANGSRPVRAHGSVPPPLPRPLVLPRLALETTFLVVVATVAALADLDAVWIAAVMLASWVLVAISEWAAFARQRSWRLEEVAPPLVDTSDPAWYAPPVESTMLEPPLASESHTIVTPLPPSEETQEHDVQLGPRRRFWRRRKDVATGADPWEQ